MVQGSPDRLAILGALERLETGFGGSDDQIANTDIRRQFPAVQNDLSQLIRLHKIRITQQLASLTAYFVAVYATATGEVLRSLTELMLIIVPARLAIIPPRTALVQFKTPLRLTSISCE